MPKIEKSDKTLKDGHTARCRRCGNQFIWMNPGKSYDGYMCLGCKREVKIKNEPGVTC